MKEELARIVQVLQEINEKLVYLPVLTGSLTGTSFLFSLWLAMKIVKEFGR